MRRVSGAPIQRGRRFRIRESAHGSAPSRDATLVQSLDRGLRILDTIIGSGKPLRLRDVAAHLAVDKASAFRLLATLERFGLVTKDPGAKTYGIGSRFIAWLATQKPTVQLIELVRPHLVRLVAETDESGHLGILGGDQALLIDYVPSTGIVTIKNRIGVYEPLHCTAVGKALLAFLPALGRQELIDRLKLERFTPRTLLDVSALEQDLARVRATGIALDRGEYHELVTCVAAPITDAAGYPIASLGISSVTPLIDREPKRLQTVIAAVKAYAARVSRQLAGKPT